MHEKTATMLIGELEKQTGVPRSTIHHYLQHGLLHQPIKTGKTMAHYDESHIRRLKQIQKIKRYYLTNTTSTRVPLDFIRHKISDGYSLTRGSKATPSKIQNKRTSENALRKKEQIIEATLKLYTKRGYYLTNIREIINQAGISAPTFYYYFQDKRELFVETIEYVMRQYRQEMKEAISDEPDPTKRGMIVLQIFYENYPIVGEILHQLRAAVAIGDPWAKERLSKLYGEMTENISKSARHMMEAGLMRRVDPQLFALFNVLLDENAVHLASVDDQYDLDQILQFLGDLISNAFLTEKGKKMFKIVNGAQQNPKEPSLYFNKNQEEK